MKARAKSDSTDAPTPGMMRGIERLLLAYCYAREVHRDQWEFAVEIQSLKEAGINNAELRWLVCKGFVQHAVEETTRDRADRVFNAVGETTFRKRSCFVLTEQGFDTFQRFLAQRLARN